MICRFIRMENHSHEENSAIRAGSSALGRGRQESAEIQVGAEGNRASAQTWRSSRFPAGRELAQLSGLRREDDVLWAARFDKRRVLHSRLRDDLRLHLFWLLRNEIDRSVLL